MEDEEIALEKSVQMWTAEGLVRSKQATLGNPVKGHFHSMQLFNIYIFFNPCLFICLKLVEDLKIVSTFYNCWHLKVGVSVGEVVRFEVCKVASL